MVKIETYMGELEIEDIYEDSLGYHAVTGEGLTQRTWYLTKARYEKLKKEMNLDNHLQNDKNQKPSGG